MSKHDSGRWGRDGTEAERLRQEGWTWRERDGKWRRTAPNGDPETLCGESGQAEMFGGVTEGREAAASPTTRNISIPRRMRTTGKIIPFPHKGPPRRDRADRARIDRDLDAECAAADRAAGRALRYAILAEEILQRAEGAMASGLEPTAPEQARENKIRAGFRAAAAAEAARAAAWAAAAARKARRRRYDDMVAEMRRHAEKSALRACQMAKGRDRDAQPVRDARPAPRRAPGDGGDAPGRRIDRGHASAAGNGWMPPDAGPQALPEADIETGDEGGADAGPPDPGLFREILGQAFDAAPPLMKSGEDDGGEDGCPERRRGFEAGGSGMNKRARNLMEEAFAAARQTDHGDPADPAWDLANRDSAARLLEAVNKGKGNEGPATAGDLETARDSLYAASIQDSRDTMLHHKRFSDAEAGRPLGERDVWNAARRRAQWLKTAYDLLQTIILRRACENDDENAYENTFLALIEILTCSRFQGEGLGETVH